MTEFEKAEKRWRCPYNEGCELECNRCIKFAALTKMLELSDIPKKYWYNREAVKMFMSKDAVDRKMFEALQSIQENIVDFVRSGEQLYICSNKAGNGKTTWAIKLMLAYFDAKSFMIPESTRGMFVNVSDYLYQAKDFSNPLPVNYRNDMKECELLILDDIAIAGLTDYDFMNLYGVIERRNLAGLATIFTGNITDPDMLEDILGERLTSRIWNSSTQIEFKGTDKRGEYTI